MHLRCRFVKVAEMYNLYFGNCSKLLLIVLSLKYKIIFVI